MTVKFRRQKDCDTQTRALDKVTLAVNAGHSLTTVFDDESTHVNDEGHQRITTSLRYSLL